MLGPRVRDSISTRTYDAVVIPGETQFPSQPPIDHISHHDPSHTLSSLAFQPFTLQPPPSLPLSIHSSILNKAPHDLSCHTRPGLLKENRQGTLRRHYQLSSPVFVLSISVRNTDVYHQLDYCQSAASLRASHRHRHRRLRHWSVLNLNLNYWCAPMLPP